MTEILMRYPESLLCPDICDFQDCDLKNEFGRATTMKTVLQLTVSNLSCLGDGCEPTKVFLGVTHGISNSCLPTTQPLKLFYNVPLFHCLKKKKAHAGQEAENVRYLMSLLPFQGPVCFFLPVEKQQRKEALQWTLLICTSSSAHSDRPDCGSSCCQPACRWLHPASG